MYDSARTALRELEDDQVFERVALHVLRARFPELRARAWHQGLTAASTGPCAASSRASLHRGCCVTVMSAIAVPWAVTTTPVASPYKGVPEGRCPSAVMV